MPKYMMPVEEEEFKQQSLKHIVSIRKTTETDGNLLIEKLSAAKVDDKIIHDMANVLANAMTALLLAEEALQE